MMELDALNAAQAEAAIHSDGPLLVFAGAGSGKTRVITYRIANLLATLRVPPYRILAVTFTNKAARELQSRLTALAGPDVTRDLWTGTFHSVCARLLRRYHAAAGLDPRFSIYDDSDQKAVMKRVLDDLGLDERAMPPRYALGRIHAEKREGRGPDDFDPSLGFDSALRDVFRGYQEALTRAGALDFEDLLLEAMRLAENPDSPAGAELRRRFDYVLVDEFQDTNTTQYRLVSALIAHTRNLCVVGDDDQSIYRWRGADVRIIRGFRRDFPDAKVVKLEQNYRSTGNIVRAALAVIEPARSREPKELWTAEPPGDPVRVIAAGSERDEAQHVVHTVRREVARGTSPRDMAVFYRVHAQSRVLEEALRSANIAYQIVGGMKFFERAEVKDVLAYLRLIDNPKSDADLLRVINVPARGIGDKTVAHVLDVAATNTLSAANALGLAAQDELLGTGPRRRLAAFRELLLELVAAGRELSPHALADLVLERSGYRERLRQDNSAESDARLENLAELLGSIAEYEEQAERLGESPTLTGYLERVSLVAAVDALEDTPAINLMTVHSAKGLEFSVVFLTGMEEEVFPYKGLDGAEPEELDEERRLAYVAVTRARKRLYISHAGARTLFGQTRYLEPSRFLRNLPQDVVTREYAHGSSYGSRAPSVPSPAKRPPPRREFTPGERIIDHSVFDDVASENHSALRPGSHVLHRRFGRGTVLQVEAGAAPTVLASFPGIGTKRIRAEFLEPG
ncbi:MAG: UvrD-helicase domain-containing protein [Polyangiaceae bacterium]|nr:UvrD-helicase domain-containing protein [Polyangiaceae bacterium]